MRVSSVTFRVPFGLSGFGLFLARRCKSQKGDTFWGLGLIYRGNTLRLLRSGLTVGFKGWV